MKLRQTAMLKNTITFLSFVLILIGISCSEDETASTDSLNADFEISVSDDIAPAEVMITNNTAGATFYSWSFVGGTPESSTDQNPSLISYSAAGEYTIVLEVSNGTETKTTSKSFTLGESLLVDFEIEINSDSAPAEVTITNNTVGATSYKLSLIHI